MKAPSKDPVREGDTRGRILDAAEKHFGREGFHRTSLRAITGEAGVNLAAVNYHFGTKEALLKEVFARRLTPLNKERIGRLKRVSEEAKRKGRSPRVADVMRAFVEPTFRFRTSVEGAGDLVSFIGRSMTDPDSTVRDVFIEFMKPVFKMLFVTTKEALPGLPAGELYWRLQFALGSFIHTMHMYDKNMNKRLGIPAVLDDEAVLKGLVRYMTAGLKAK